MEKKKLDRNSIIGFVIIAGLLIWMMLNNINKEQESIKKDTELAEKEIVKQEQSATFEKALQAPVEGDTLQSEQVRATFGPFAYSAMLPAAKGGTTTLKSDLLTLEVDNKGGKLSHVVVNDFKRFSKDSEEIVALIKDHNAKFNLQLHTNDNRVFNTEDLYFEPTLSKEGENQVLAMRLKASETEFLEYRYVLKPNDYMLDFSIRTQGLSKIVDASKTPELNWEMKTYRNEKSIAYENRYVRLYYEHEKGKDNNLSESSKDDTKELKDVSYIAYKQHFFTSILLTNKNFETATLNTKNLVADEKVDTVFTKQFASTIPLNYSNGELNYDMNWYFGPSDFKILKSYERNLDNIVPLGWGIFGWINRFLFIPVFGLLTSFLPYGIGIIVLTILVRLFTSPLTYKSYVSQAKMKMIRPEVNELNEKFKNDPMKKQQETMKLYSKAGVNPMAGCIPALLQIPIFYSLFQFFPSSFDLRQKSFLWADDLSSYDSVLQLPFNIPFYGNHVSLFPLLASIAIFFYMKMTTGDQQMAQPTQEGMPDMSKIMKIMIYVSPIMMLFFFNNYASGLSLYYFISNSITIGIMYVIKNHIVKDEKILATIEENKTKKRPQGKWQRKMQEMMEQAQEQQRLKDQNKK
ncbi:membrane protein insertase YidC [Myroides sp. 1354]|uniref:membrane protein insertase YidC n=1 Tax=unclassified Myroides TaxID=2642485 RepID=UPI0025782343|nr:MULTISPECIES: membrane protein insertase YidC [unclassified Myroides]MDM1046562.1 membrane protein insertase YidC [Myroides sp. R163-1]MDM1057498.1 membrane protein insertase YidC [Myroides sp. 1354]MDM1070783.1 membrane protein insertase YidC [Myroides sp. 1372]